MNSYPQIMRWIWHVRGLSSGEQEMKIMCREISEGAAEAITLITDLPNEEPIRKLLVPELDASIAELEETLKLLTAAVEDCIKAREAL